MTASPEIRPSQPQSIGEVLDTSFRLYRASLGQVWPIALLLVLASSPTSIYTFTHGGMPAPTADNPFAALAVMSDPGYWMMYLLGMVLMLWVVGALYLKQHAIGAGTSLTLGQSLQLSLGKIVTLLVMTILLAIAISVGLLLLLIPGFILMVSLMLCWNIALIEGRGPLQSLVDSHALVWGHWWRTTAILSVAMIIVLVLYFAIALLIGAVMPFLPGASSPKTIGLVTGLLIGVGANIVAVPFYTALLMAVYWDLKLRKQGGDLAARVSALGAV